MQDPKEAYNAEIMERLKAQAFPTSRIPEHFLAWAGYALRHESKNTLNCDTATFLRLHDLIINPAAAPMNFFDAGFLINAIETKTPDQLAGYDYVGVITAVQEMTDFWNETVEPIKQALMRKLQAQHNISRGVPDHKRIIGKA